MFLLHFPTQLSQIVEQLIKASQYLYCPEDSQVKWIHIIDSACQTKV
jgi:hypothetical protein